MFFGDGWWVFYPLVHTQQCSVTWFSSAYAVWCHRGLEPIQGYRSVELTQRDAVLNVETLT